MNRRPRIILATPHSRYDSLESALRNVHDFDVIRLRNREELSECHLKVLRPNHIFLPHWSWMVPAAVYENFECIVFHMTDLPFGRGGSPLQNLIVRGFKDTQLSAIRCEELLDAGPVYCKRPLSLDGSAEQIFERAARLMEGMCVEIVRGAKIPQVQTGAPTFFTRRQPSESEIAGLDSLMGVYDHIRMLDAEGYPPAYLDVGRLHLEFHEARLTDSGVTAMTYITLISEEKSKQR